MPLQDQNTAIPVPLSSGREGGFKLGDELTMYGQTVKVVGTRPDGSPIVDLSGVSQPKVQQKTGIPKRGQWLGNRLRGLYEDPMYAKGSPDVQKYYKNQAYDKWVVPYFKHIKIEPPTRETFLTGTPDKPIDHVGYWQQRINEAQKQGIAVLSRSSKTLAGVSSLLETITQPFEDAIVHKGKPTFKTEDLPLQKVLKTAESYYDKQAADLDARIEDKGGSDLKTKIADIGTQAIFFEALGGAKAAEVFKFANPRTGAVAAKIAKTAWNGAVTGALWGPTTGGRLKDIPTDAASFALLDLGFTGASAGFMKVFNSITSEGVASQVVAETAQELATGKGVVKPKVEEFVKGGGEVNKQAAKAAVAKSLNEAAQKVAGGETNGAFKRLTPKQQKALLLRISMASAQARDLSIDNEVATENLVEQEAKMQGVVPAAAQVQKQVDDVIKQAGLDPVQAKLGATLPHHQTHIDSPIQHITARISYLTNRLKARGREELITSDVEALKEALAQEKQLLKDAKAKRETLKKSNLTAGATPLSIPRMERFTPTHYQEVNKRIESIADIPHEIIMNVVDKVPYTLHNIEDHDKRIAVQAALNEYKESSVFRNMADAARHYVHNNSAIVDAGRDLVNLSRLRYSSKVGYGEYKENFPVDPETRMFDGSMWGRDSIGVFDAQRMARDLYNLVRHAPEANRELHRGIKFGFQDFGGGKSLAEHEVELVNMYDKLEPGDSIDLPLSSFSTNPDVATDFAFGGARRFRLHITDGPVKSVSMVPFNWYRESEHITQGGFEVTRVEKNFEKGRDVTDIYMKQKEFF